MENKLLFCLPYAGTSASFYYRWQTLINGSVKLIPIELAGKGKRIRENQYVSFDAAVDDLYKIISSRLNSHDSYTIFGHSMGALLAYEVYYMLAKNHVKLPEHLWLSGHQPPHVPSTDLFHLLPTDKFIEKIREIGGAPDEFFESPELLSIFIPILRKDYEILGDYHYREKPQKILCDITVFHGTEDQIVPGDIHGWSQYTQNRCFFHFFYGNHFFIHQYAQDILDIIKNRLS